MIIGSEKNLIDNVTFFAILWILLGIELLILGYLIKTFLSINKKVDNLLKIRQNEIQLKEMQQKKIQQKKIYRKKKQKKKRQKKKKQKK